MILTSSIASRLLAPDGGGTGSASGSPTVVTRGGAPSSTGSVEGDLEGTPAAAPAAPAAPPDLFEDLDLDLLDDKSRQVIEKARKEVTDLRSKAGQGTALQSKFDKAQSDLQQLQNQLRQTQAQQPQQNGNTPKTFEQELEEVYISEGVTPEAAKKAASMQAKILGKFGSRIDQHVSSRVAPVAESVADREAEIAFKEAKINDRLGMFTDEIAQEVWEKIEVMKENGQPVSTALVENLASISYIKAIKSGKLQPSHMQQSNPQAAPVSQFSFPGAGNVPAAPRQNAPTRTLDADTDAAMAATVGHWLVKPKHYRNKR